MSLSLSLSLSLYLSLSIFFGHVMSSHHSEQMSQRSQVSRIALRRCSQNVFVIVFVFVFVNFFWSGHSSFVCKFGHIILFAYLYLPNICTKHTTYDT